MRIKKTFRKGQSYHVDETGQLPAECVLYFVKDGDDISEFDRCIKSFVVEIKITELKE